MLFQTLPITPIDIISPLISFLIFAFITGIAIYNYNKLKIFELGVLIMLISLIFVLISIQQNIMMFTPYFQIFFLFFQLIIFYQIIKNRA